MKKLFTLLVFVGLVSFARAQFLIVSPSDTFIYSGTLVNEFDNQELDGSVTYTGSSADTIRWYVHALNHPAGWEMSVCDINNCYIIYTPGTVYEFTTQPNVANLLRFGVTPYCTSGNGVLEVTIWAASDSAGTVTKAYFGAEYTGACATSIKEETLSKVKVYPSNFQSRITIEGGDRAKISAVKMYDVLGGLVNTAKPLVNNSANIETSDLSSGVYIVRVETSEGVISKRVVKQ